MAKNTDDTELIITNAEEQQPEAVDTQATPAAEAEPAKEVKDFKKVLDEQIHEEDAAPNQGLTVIKILGGDFFAAQILRRQIGVILLLVFFSLIYISNRYSCQKSMLEIDKLKQELQDAKYKALSTSSQLTEMSRQSNVLDMLKNCKDSTLKISDQPPYKINIPAE